MLELLRSTAAYGRLVAAVKAKQNIPGLGLLRAARLAVTACLQVDVPAPIFMITDRSDHALTCMDELGFWAPKGRRILFPEPGPLFYEQAAWGAPVRRDRLQALTTLATYHLSGAQKPETHPIILATARGLMTRTLPRRDFIKNSRQLSVGDHISPDQLIRQWVGIGYQGVSVVLEQGQFSHRGGILDIWPPAEPLPARLEFFGDEIDTLRHFDPATQRTVRSLERLLVTPAREYLPGYVKDETLPDELGEFYLPQIHPSPASILDYLPPQALILIDDLDILRATITDYEEQAVKFRRESIVENTLPDDAPVPYLSWSELQDSLYGRHCLELGYSTAGEPSEMSQLFSPGPRFGGRLKPFVDYLVERDAKKERIVIVSRQSARLKELWGERQAPAAQPEQGMEFVEGTLSEGWILKAQGQSPVHLFTDSEIFGWERPQPRQAHRPVAEAPETAFADLKPGDWVVHVDYGIGRYSGLVRRSLEGVEREFLALEYEGGDQLYVPIHQADRITRFLGPDSQFPSPTRLGSSDWAQTKQKVRSAVEEVAKELLDLYAQRQVAEGHSFSEDTAWQQELEASFPYIETSDQIRAIGEVKADMQKPRPMDRLLCGDVGYGKTEVALRAAFKAVMDNKQVAVLVPTTVLAQQHYDTFCQRLAPFPVEVEMLSRFRSPKEQEAILRRLEKGGVDIVIGTHRLVQADVQFKDLGLVIIDEEQRFGVTHKEHLKRLRTEVDVLTLTATPIPRTLYMALTGVRDISTINTPPEERLPIITHIGPYSPRLVRQSILRELDRGGQVFFVHNRVHTIEAMRRHLAQLVPEARVGVGHGQLHEDALARVMHQFTHSEIDVLLCTSIIESGLDIPNANTLIVDRADAFGLAQLYQLRGRVGRGGQRAYAYFFRHRKRKPTVEGEERLEVIAENTQLGAGYSIAMRDLEMRGAGEVLGTRQHGYIASVGFHLYTRLLAQAVRSERIARGLPRVPEEEAKAFKEGHLPVSVDLPLSIGIPVDYIPEQEIRLGLYRRLGNVENDEQIDMMAAEFADRFGPLPGMVKNLFYQLKVKLRVEAAGLASVSIENDQFVLRFPPLPEGANSRELVSIGRDSRVGKNAYWIPYTAHQDDWQARLLEALSTIIEVYQPVPLAKPG
ncbi:MAG: transcription-repair coupling factor [Anaerolineaceae bacterium]|nr:transcription-repair coupling factor [Anaerolineaceae bacterium]